MNSSTYERWQPAHAYAMPQPHERTVGLECKILVYVTYHHLQLQLELEVVRYSSVPLFSKFIPELLIEQYLPWLHTHVLDQSQLL